MQPSWLVGDSSAGHVESLCSPELHFPLLATDDDDLQLSPPFCRHGGRPSTSDITSGKRTATDVSEPAGSSSRCRRSGCQASAAADAWSAVRRGACNRGTAADCVWPMEEDQGANSSAASGGGVVTQRRRAGVGGRHRSSTAIRSAVSSPPETARSSKQPPQAEIKAAAGSSRSRGGGSSSRTRSNCLDDDDGGMRHASVATLLAYVYYRASVSLQNRPLPPCRRRVLRLQLTWNWTCQ